MLPKDQDHRLLAAIPGDFNVIVEAGAGTGKTTLLIDRLCFLILGKGISVDKIIALTFTDKAAAEIKVRLQAKMQIILAELSKEEVRDKTTLTLLQDFGRKKSEIEKDIQNYFDLLERAQISTIHSFCLNILRRYPLESGLAPQAAVDEGSFKEKLFDIKWTAFLEQELGLESKNKEFWQNLLGEVSLEDAKEFAWNIVKVGAENYTPLKTSEQVKSLCLAYAKRAGELCAIHSDTNKRSSMLPKLGIAESVLKETAAFLENPVFKKSVYETGSVPSCPKNWPEQDYEEAVSILKLAEELNINKQITILKFFNILMPFAAEFAVEFRKYNILTFHDIIEKTRNLLKVNTAVRNELKKDYISILIDEFQDTDPAQGEILLFLAESNNVRNPVHNWREIIPEQGKLFVVGDPKQTIYNFRGADINAYEEFTDLMLRHGAKKCFLQTNFRSSPQIIDFANTAGKSLIVEEKGIQPGYIPINHGKDFKGPPVTVVAVHNREEGSPNTEAYRHNQAQFIASWIKENARKIKLADGKPLAYKDIAILLRTTTALNTYTSALERFDIKYTVEADNNFYTAQEVLDILNILRVIYNPLDSAALVGVLRSPFGLVKDADIIRLKEQGRLSIFAKQQDDIPNVKQVFNILKELHNEAGKIPLRKLLSKIIFNTDFLEMQTVSTAKEQVVANIFKLFDIVNQMRGLGVMTLGQFLFSVQEFIDNQKKEGASPLTEESLDTVNIMTIHKAKGLEFKMVIIADISKQENANMHRSKLLFDWDKNVYGLRLGKMVDFNFALLEPMRKIHGRAEESRVLYVALTRAKERLMLVGDLTEDKNSIASSLQKANLYPSPEDTGKELKSNDYSLEVINTPFRDTESFINTNYYDESSKELKLDIPQWLESWKKREEVFDKINSQKIFDTPSSPGDILSLDSTQALIGTVSHKIMESVFSGRPRTAQQAAAVTGISLGEDELAVAQDIIEKFKASKDFEVLKGYKQIASELPFTLDKDGITINGVIDAVFDTGGTILIADYKTDNIKPEQAQEHSIKYKNQLETYKTAMQKLMPTKQLQAAIIYLRTQQVIYI